MSLGRYCPSPLAHQTLSTFRREYLARVKIQRDFNWLPGLHILEVLLALRLAKQVAVTIDNERGNSADLTMPATMPG